MTLVLLDRDGVINIDLPQGVISADAFTLIPGSAAAISRLNAAGINVAICTNQSNIGRGNLTEEGLHAIHEKMRTLLAQDAAHIDAIYFCPDHPDTATARRKPGAGMLQEAMQAFGATPDATPFFGDAITDFQAAHAIGCPFYLVQTGKGEATAERPEVKSAQSVTIIADLAQGVDAWLRNLNSAS